MGYIIRERLQSFSFGSILNSHKMMILMMMMMIIGRSYALRTVVSETCDTCPFGQLKNGHYPPPINAGEDFVGTIHRGSFFDVYGDWIETRYSEVFWTAQPAVDLPSYIVEKFAGKSISFTGFEVDVIDEQNRSIPEFQIYNHHYCATIQGDGSTMVKVGSREQDSLLRDDRDRTRRRAFEVHPPEFEPRDTPGFSSDSTIPTAHNFWQGNGGEHRKSFKYLPMGTGQLLESPKSFVLQPMLINTNFQGGSDPSAKNKTARQLFHEAPLPKNSISPPGANYSGLMECPCTTRTTKIITGYTTAASGQCSTIVENADECFVAVSGLLGGRVVSNNTVTSDAAPSGCFVVAHSKGNEAYFNANTTSNTQCGENSGAPVRSKGDATSASGDLTMHIDLDGSSGNVTFTLVGPSDVWFGVGFNASAMADAPYTIVVDGDGNVTERKLANHMPGQILENSIDVLSNTVGPEPSLSAPMRMNRVGGVELRPPFEVMEWSTCLDACNKDESCASWLYDPVRWTTVYNLEKEGKCTLFRDDDKSLFTWHDWVEGMVSDIKRTKQMVRTVVLRRPLTGMTTEHFTFDPKSNGFPFIEAVGTTSTFQYHGTSRGGNTLVLVEDGAPICVCEGSSPGGSINGIPWSNNCEDWPATTILRDHNPSCSIATYEGGMICCHHGIYLLDAEQPIPPETFKFRMRFRFWWEDPATQASNASSVSRMVWGDDLPYQNAFFMFRETEVAHGEYDVPKCATGTKPGDCVHTIVGNFQVKDTMHECTGRSDVWCSPVNLPNASYPQSDAVALVHISPHCHGPACISMKMIDRDRNNATICETFPAYGSTDNAMNESGYASGIPPCIWGTPEEGLPPPPILRLDSNITVIKRVNSTNGHRGVMGHWQMRGIWAKEENYN